MRSPGDIGRIASAALGATTSSSQQQQLQKQQEPAASSSSSVQPRLPSSSAIQTHPTTSQSSSVAAPLPSVVHSPSLPSVPANNTPVPIPEASTFMGASASLQGPNSQIAQLQMQNYLQQLLLLQQNAMLSAGTMPMLGAGTVPMLGLQGIPNPLIGQTTGQAGFATGQTSFPPGFAPPSLTRTSTVAAHTVPSPLTTPVADGSALNASGLASQTGLTGTTQTASTTSGATGQASQTGLTCTTQAASTASGATGQTSQTEHTQTTNLASATPQDEPDPATTTQHAPTIDSSHQTSNPIHPTVSSTQLDADSTLLSATSVVIAVANGRSAGGHKSSSTSSSLLSDDSSSVSSEGEALQSSRRRGNHVDSCLADSESENQQMRAEEKSAVAGESQLFFSGGAQSPAWAKEKAFIKRCVCVCVCMHTLLTRLMSLHIHTSVRGPHRVRLTHDHSLSVLRHNDKAYFISSEVSEWFWESDLLQSMLRQIQKPCWGLFLTEKKNKKLFQTLRRVQVTSRFVLSRQQITVYSLEEYVLACV